jgi:3-oxoacyl-[acyl-carrier-protein] synthase II
MFQPEDFFGNAKNVRSNDRFTHFSVAAARLALQDAKLAKADSNAAELITCDPHRVGCMVGSAFGGMESFEQETFKLAKKPERPKVCLCVCHGMKCVGCSVLKRAKDRREWGTAMYWRPQLI